jgi:hypothetical protein
LLTLYLLLNYYYFVANFVESVAAVGAGTGAAKN